MNVGGGADGKMYIQVLLLSLDTRKSCVGVYEKVGELIGKVVGSVWLYGRIMISERRIFSAKVREYS